MKKLLLPITLITSLYAVPPCEHEQSKVCVYLYKGAMSAEANIINMTDKSILASGKITLDGRMTEIKDYTILPNQTITIIKSKYDNPNQKPNLGWENFNYKYVN